MSNSLSLPNFPFGITDYPPTLSGTWYQFTDGTLESPYNILVQAGPGTTGIGNSQPANWLTSSLASGATPATLIAGASPQTTLQAVYGDAYLISGSTAVGSRTLIGNDASTTLLAGAGKDSLVGWTGKNLFLVTPENQSAFFKDKFQVSTQTSAKNIIGLSLDAGVQVTDSHFAGMASQNVGNMGVIDNLSSESAAIILGANAEKIGLKTLVSGTGRDTLSAGAYTKSSVLLDASQAINHASLVGSQAGQSTIRASDGGFDTIVASGSKNTIVVQNANLGSIVGGAKNGTGNTLQAYAALTGTSFANVSNLQVLALNAPGSQIIGSLQGSGISTIVGNQPTIVGNATLQPPQASNTLALNVYAPARLTAKGSSTLVLSNPTSNGSTLGFTQGVVLSGNGIAVGTTVINAVAYPDRKSITLTLSQPTIQAIAIGTTINGWLSGTINDSMSSGLFSNPTIISAATQNFNELLGYNQANPAPNSTVNSGILGKNYGLPFELQKDANDLKSLVRDPSTAITVQGDVLTNLGQRALLLAPANAQISQGQNVVTGTIYSAYYQDNPTSLHSAYGTLSAKDGSSTLKPGQVAGDYLPYSVTLKSAISNTLVSGAYASNTLVGGVGENLYKINNPSGYKGILPWISNSYPILTGFQNTQTVQSASTIEFLGNGVTLNDSNLTQVQRGSAQRLVTSDGNNLIVLGNAAKTIGIQTIVGGKGSDTFALPSSLTASVYLDASRNGGRSSLSAGGGNDTLVAGGGNNTLLGRDGNNSLVGGNGSNVIISGVGDSTLDSGYGVSTLQADGGTNVFIVRNRFTRILPPNDGSVEATGIVDTYVNFDPILGDPVKQFAPEVPDNSPSITKSSSFASSDLNSFYGLQHFNLLGSANYGVGNAKDNRMTVSAPNSLLLGMGGNNTLSASGAGSSLYGNSNAEYASPDHYAYAPFDPRDQQFVDRVMGLSGDNSLVATGGKSYLDGGPSSGSTGSNTMIGTGGNDTVIQSHIADVISLTGASNTVISSVDVYDAPDNVTELILNVTPQLPNSGQVTLAGQRVTASYGAIAGGTGSNADTTTVSIGQAPAITVSNGSSVQVAYGTSDGTIYGTTGVAGINKTLSQGAVLPDPNNTGKQAVSLTWSVPTVPGAGGAPEVAAQIMGYTVEYQIVAKDVNTGSVLNTTPFLTFLQGTSDDLSGTSFRPSLYVDNLAQSFSDSYTGVTYAANPQAGQVKANISYNFKVTSRETVLPAYTDGTGKLVPKPVSLIGGQGNDVLYSGLLENTGTGNSNTRPVLTNNPINPEDPGEIATPAPWSPTAKTSGLFPTYLAGGLSGDDLLISAPVKDRSGASFKASGTINGTVQTVTYSGLNTLVGGQGSDTFVVSNGGTRLSINNGVVSTSTFDSIIKYGKETPVGTHNLVISSVPFLSLSDTTVDQGQFIDRAWTSGLTDSLGNAVPQYLGGNRLDNTLVSYGAEVIDASNTNTLKGNTLLGAGGRDLLDGRKSSAPATLIGGTAYGLDSVKGAINDFAPTSGGGKGQKNSIYRDLDPVPAYLLSGPGSVDPSQYWFSGGKFDSLRNSDTLLAGSYVPVSNGSSDTTTSGTSSDVSLTTKGDLLDGGAGNDSMVGGDSNDTLYVSSSLGISSNSLVGKGDVVLGGGGNDWLVYTGSDVYWSGKSTALNTSPFGTATSKVGSATTSTLGYRLSESGDAAGKTSISNVKLQDGDSVALWAVGNKTSTGNVSYIDTIGSGTTDSGQSSGSTGGTSKELGSNSLIGNEYNNSLWGGGVGGATGKGIGCDTLTGGGGSDYFVVSSSIFTSKNSQDASYTLSTADKRATNEEFINAVDGTPWVSTDKQGNALWATDADYVVVTDFDSLDKLVLSKDSLGANDWSNYAIGAPPTGFQGNNIQGVVAASIAGLNNNGTRTDPSSWNAPLFNTPTSTSTDFGIYYLGNNGATPNLVAEIRTAGGFTLGSLGGVLTVGGVAVDGTYDNLGGLIASNMSTPAQNYLGYGKMYQLQGSDFASHVTFA